jgi:hypothetical protein
MRTTNGRSHALPLPPAGAIESVRETSDTVFNWKYDLPREPLNAPSCGIVRTWSSTPRT